MQVKNSKREGQLLRGIVLGLSMSAALTVTQVAHAQFPGGFQSDVSGAVPIQFAPAVGGAAAGGPNGSVAIGSLPADVQTNLNNATASLLAGAAGMPTTELTSASECVTTNFPDSPQARAYHRALNAALADMGKLNDNAKAAVPGDNTLRLQSLYATAAMTKRLRQDLMSLVQATNALAQNATPQQLVCINQSYDAIEKAVTGLEQIAQAVNTATSIASSAHNMATGMAGTAH